MTSDPPSAPLPRPLPRKLNVGCGYDRREGYLNVDLHAVHKPDLVADVTHLPMLPSESFDEILAQDVLEHFERAKTAPALTLNGHACSRRTASCMFGCRACSACSSCLPPRSAANPLKLRKSCT
jgi:hypothetical protein